MSVTLGLPLWTSGTSVRPQGNWEGGMGEGRGRLAAVSGPPVSPLVGVPATRAPPARIVPRGPLGGTVLHTSFVTRATSIVPAPDARRQRIDDRRHWWCLLWLTPPPRLRSTARGTTCSTGVATAGCRGVHASAPSAPYSLPHRCAHPTCGVHYRRTQCGRADGGCPSLDNRPNRKTRPPGPCPPAVLLVAPAACPRAAPLCQLVARRALAAPFPCKDARPCACSLIHVQITLVGAGAERPSWQCPLRQRGRNWPSCHCQDCNVACDPAVCSPFTVGRPPPPTSAAAAVPTPQVDIAGASQGAERGRRRPGVRTCGGGQRFSGSWTPGKRAGPCCAAVAPDGVTVGRVATLPRGAAAGRRGL